MNARTSSKILHKTKFGKYWHGKAEDLLSGDLGARLQGKVQLILTSPPFPLNTKKSYGNLKGREYLEWFVSLAEPLSRLMTPSGSIVIEIGNAWEPKRPIQSLLPLQCLLGFAAAPGVDLRLCQEFICYNPARLPSPAHWVTVKRERLTDSYTRVWWLSKSDHPQADNARVLRPYSQSMKSLLKKKAFNRKARPSQHHISEHGFLRENAGSIAHNFIELEPMSARREVRLPNAISLANTASNDGFARACRDRGIKPHPARMPGGLASFFIEFLTQPGDLVFDPFGGSNTTGYAAEQAGRKWEVVEADASYAEQSKLRFQASAE